MLFNPQDTTSSSESKSDSVFHSTLSSNTSSNCEVIKKDIKNKQIVRRTSAPTTSSNTHCNKQQVKPHHCHQGSLPLSLETSVVYDTPRVTSPNKEKRREKSERRSRRERRSKKNNMSTSTTTTTTDIQLPDEERAAYLCSDKDTTFNLRPPNETTNEVTVSSWRHTPAQLINNQCTYQAYYLGSMLVAELKGVESTIEACSKMKKSTDNMKKIPTITLSISYRGVRFIDYKSKHQIAEHDISNISFASQDHEDLNTFAYITHDSKTGFHYCHVFRVPSLDKAYEIILTIGQAFEVAYQLILKNQKVNQQQLELEEKDNKDIVNDDQQR